MDNDLKEYLQQSKYCNFDHPEIQRTAQEIAGKFDDPTEKATALFYWVRDQILYRVGLWNRTASETLAEMEGTCTNCANLLVAFLRYYNIPAGYGIMKVYGKKYFGPVIPPLMRKYISKYSVHIYATVYVNGKWVKVDASDDYEFCKSTGYFNPTAEILDWDGKSNTMLPLNKEYIINDKWPVADITPWMEKEIKNGKPSLRLTIANLYVHFLRINRTKVNYISELQPLFLDYLRRHHPFLCVIYYLYYSLFKLSEFKGKPAKEKPIGTLEKQTESC